MNQKDKEIFINELCDSVKESIINKIEFMPNGWDGVELRQYIAERFNGVVMKSSMTISRKKSYNNTVLVNNL